MNDDISALLAALREHEREEGTVYVRVRVGFPDDPDVEALTTTAEVLDAEDWDHEGSRHVRLYCEEVLSQEAPPLLSDVATGPAQLSIMAHTTRAGEWMGPMGSYVARRDDDGTPNHARLDVQSVELADDGGGGEEAQNGQ